MGYKCLLVIGMYLSGGKLTNKNAMAILALFKEQKRRRSYREGRKEASIHVDMVS